MAAARRASQEDLPGLLALYAQLNPDDPPLDPLEAQHAWADIIVAPGMWVFVADDAGTIAATCTLVVVPNLTRGARPYALIENVVTDASRRRRGFGAAVMQAAITMAWRQHSYKVMLLTGSTRPETLHFYAGLGFRQNKTGFQIRRSEAI